MKTFKIIELNLKNFKGKKEFSLKANGKDLTVKGRNESGKTTIYDAFTWLLFGKDSLNRADFSVKTLDEEGNVAYPGIDHEVEGVFEVDGKKLTLKRTHAENWVKKRGSAKKEKAGHKNKFYIDEEPVQKKVYTDKINEIIPSKTKESESEKAFRLLTSHTYFNEVLNWKDRRNILIELAGDVTDEELTNENKDLEQLLDKLEGRTVESYKNIVNSRRKKINEELDTIPVRIDEIHLSIPDVRGLDRKALEGMAVNIKEKIKAKNSEINDIRSGAEINNKKKELSDLELSLKEIKNKHGQDINNDIYKAQAGLQEAQSNIRLLESQIDNDSRMVESNQKQIDFIDEKVKELRKEYATQKSIEFSYEGDCNCPVCKQELPEDQIEDARQKALESFNKMKSEKLETIIKNAEGFKKEIETLEESNKKTNSTIEKVEKELNSTRKKEVQLQDDLENLKSNVTDINDNVEYKNTKDRIKDVHDQINYLEASANDSIGSVEKDINALEYQLKEVQDDLNKIDMADKTKDRMAELENKEQELSRQLEDLDKDLYLIDEHTKTKVSLIESKINSKFKYARFKLFEKQINDGIREICDTTYKGIPYGKGLNTADCINVGLDIIDVLSKHYGLQAPIFVDNAESVINLAEIDTQVIRLKVEDQDLEVIEETA